MNTKPPFIFRFMLFSLFLPIFLAVGVLVYCLWKYVPELYQEQSRLDGIPSLWILIAGQLLPFVLGVWLFWSGKWRKPVLVAGTVYYGFILFLILTGPHNEITPPEKRLIELADYPGSDVYCNGVHLGQTPLKISVEELTKKVPEWTTPPEQRWYNNTIEPNYTWLPWDNFRKSRFQEAQELYKEFYSPEPAASSRRLKEARVAKITRFDAECRYWWRLEYGGKRQFRATPNRYNYHISSFDKVRNYNVDGGFFSSSVPYHAWLLFEVLKDLPPEEKNEWDKHVLKHWMFLEHYLQRFVTQEQNKLQSKDKNDPRQKFWETIFESTARLKFGLSDPPTEEECRRLLNQWVAESLHDKTFSSGQSMDSEYASAVVITDQILVNAAIKVMGKTVRKPLTEQWRRHYYRYENGWSPLICIAASDHGAEYFDDFVRYSVSSFTGRYDLLNNEDERVLPLFKTLLYRKPLLPLLERVVPEGIAKFRPITNPLLEPVYRKYIEETFSDTKLTDYQRKQLNAQVADAISLRIILLRIQQNETEAIELATWVRSLPLPQPLKDVLLRRITLIPGNAKTFAEILQQSIDPSLFIETEKTVEEINRWFAEHPAGTLGVFCKEFQDDFLIENNSIQISEGDFFQLPQNKPQASSPTGPTDLGSCLVRALLKITLRETSLPETNVQECQKTITQLWNNGTDQSIIFRVIRTEYSAHHAANRHSEFPDYLLDLFEESNEPEIAFLSPLLTNNPSPKVRNILEKTAGIAKDPILKREALGCLEIWQTRNTIRQKQKELYRDLIEEKITPDDLLPPQPGWVWKDGKYVQE